MFVRKVLNFKFNRSNMNKTNKRSIKREGLHMDYKRKIIELLSRITDAETLAFIYEIVKRLSG